MILYGYDYVPLPIRVYIARCSFMALDINGDGRAMAKPEGLLGPLPTLNLIPSVDKLDAGLRSFDHCES